jgi:hypothetical protein
VLEAQRLGVGLALRALAARRPARRAPLCPSSSKGPQPVADHDRPTVRRAGSSRNRDLVADRARSPRVTALLAVVLALVGSGAEAERFVPPTSVDAGRVAVPLTFTDGTRAELSYPPRLRLAERGVVPYASGELRGAGARDFQILYGDVEDVLSRAHPGATLLKTYPGAGGETVGLWATPRDEPHHRLHLAFQFGRWTVLVYDYPSEFDGGGASMSDAERAEWARSMSGRATAGLLRLEAGGRLRLARSGERAGPQLAFGGLGGPLTLIPGPCRRTRDHDHRIDGRWVSWNRSFASWCVSPTMRADVHGSRRWMRSLIRHIDVQAMHPSAPHANMCSCAGKSKPWRATRRAGCPGSPKRR